MSDIKLLIVDDDRELCSLLSTFLKQEGFASDCVHDGEQAIEACKQNDYGLMILDVMMPKKDGFQTLRELRSFSNLPVIMLTAKGDKIDRIVGLEIGADDYVPKPCDPRELVARINAILRRTNIHDKNKILENNEGHPTISINDLVIQRESREVFIAGNPIELTSTEFDFLVVLAVNSGQLVTRDTLSQKVLGKRLQAFDRSIDMHISHLRKKLGTYSDKTERIKTRRGSGYQLVVRPTKTLIANSK